MWQLCHFQTNSEWVILNLKGNNVNIVKSKKNGETCISQYLIIHVIKRIQVKNFCVSSPRWCVACFDLKTLDNIPTDDTFECYEKKYSSWKTHIISYLIRNMNNRILREHEAKFFVSLPRGVCLPVLVQARLKTLNKGRAANVCLLLVILITIIRSKSAANICLLLVILITIVIAKLWTKKHPQMFVCLW